jgi:hypothetical protein
MGQADAIMWHADLAFQLRPGRRDEADQSSLSPRRKDQGHGSLAGEDYNRNSTNHASRAVVAELVELTTEP